MALVQKLNVVLTIDDDRVKEYLNKGYNVIDNSGRVIKEAMPNDLNQLKLLVAKYKKENEELLARVKELEAQKPMAEEVKVEAPKRTRKKSSPSEE